MIQMKDSEAIKRELHFGCTDMGLHDIVYNSIIVVVIRAFLFRLCIIFAA